jgi:hypothetical protein
MQPYAVLQQAPNRTVVVCTAAYEQYNGNVEEKEQRGVAGKVLTRRDWWNWERWAYFFSLSQARQILEALMPHIRPVDKGDALMQPYSISPTK